MSCAERPVPDASYLLKTPEGQIIEVIVLTVDEDDVTFRRLGGGKTTFTFPVQRFMEATL